MKYKLICGDALTVLKKLPSGFVQCCVTSPPYFGLRDYGKEGQLGLESSPSEFVATLVEVFREVRRVLKNDGTLWVTIGDCYATSKSKRSARKSLLGIPWMLAFALRDDGWRLRQDIIWHKPNPMPENVKDRCTKAHEYIFMMAKSPRYFYDAEAVKESSLGIKRVNHKFGGSKYGKSDDPKFETKSGNAYTDNGKRNLRSVWTIPPKPYADAHFAVFPPDLVRPCIRAGSKERSVVLDPFNGSGTTGLVAMQEGRQYLGIDLNPEYIEMTKKRFEGEFL